MEQAMHGGLVCTDEWQASEARVVNEGERISSAERDVRQTRSLRVEDLVELPEERLSATFDDCPGARDPHKPPKTGA
jgi:hypothetical protein